MDKEEILKRQMCQDPRVFNAIQKAKQTDKAFTDRGFMNMFPPTYKQHEVREIWFDALALGMNEGLRMATIQGQQIDLTLNCKNQKHRDFLEKFYELSKEYNCAITYHPLKGMMVIDLNNNEK